jgi:hypothetical protein
LSTVIDVGGIKVSAAVGMTHFPGLEFQRITTANGREWTTAG